MKLDIEPYLSTLTPPWPNSEIAKPGEKVLIVSDLGTHKFNKWAKLDGYFNLKRKAKLGDSDEFHTYDPKTWWEDGMQSRVAHVVHILTDDAHEGIYCGFCFQNHPDYFMLLGRLKDNTELTEAYRKAFIDFAKTTFSS